MRETFLAIVKPRKYIIEYIVTYFYMLNNNKTALSHQDKAVKFLLIDIFIPVNMRDIKQP